MHKKCVQCTVHRNQPKEKKTLKGDDSLSDPCLFSLLQKELSRLSVLNGPTRQLSVYVHESLDLTFVERETTEGLGGTSGLRYLALVRGSEP